jgi:MSHA biogenesis protein MshJ
MFQKQTYAVRLTIEKINKRERYLLVVTLAAIILLVTHLVLMVTGLDSHELVLERIEQKKADSARLEQVLVEYKAAINNPRLVALNNSNEDLQSKIDLLEQRIGDINEKLMSPDQMIALLKELMDKQSNLTVIRFDVQPVQVIESNLDGGNLFYQHSLTMKLEGEFEALTNYLSEIESLSSQLFWDDLIIETGRFPVLEIQLKVHTLSQDEEWLNV